VEVLEEKTPDHPGLNLSFEIRDGLIKHRTEYDKPLATDTLMPSLEAQIVNIADEIAYQNHDIDDGIRAGILNAGDLASLAIWQAAAKEVKKYEPAELWSRAVISRLITLMINDMAAETDRRIAATGITSVEQVNKTKSALAGFSADMLAMTIELKKYLFANFYSSKGVADYHKKGKKIIHTLFQKFIKDPGLMPEKTSSNVRDPIEIVVKDYIAGMTDNFALEMYNKFKI
jgi:dGTPase